MSLARRESRSDFLELSLQLLDASEWKLVAYGGFFRVSGGASTAVVGLYLERTALERIGKGQKRLSTLPHCDSTDQTLRIPLRITCQCLSKRSSVEVGSLFRSFFCSGWLWEARLLLLRPCEYTRELRRTVIHRSGFDPGTKTRDHRRPRRASGGYPGLRVAVTYKDDPGWMHERLMLWEVEPDRFVVLTPDGDMYEEMRETWRSAQIMTLSRRTRLSCRVPHTWCRAYFLLQLDW